MSRSRSRSATRITCVSHVWLPRNQKPIRVSGTNRPGSTLLAGKFIVAPRYEAIFGGRKNIEASRSFTGSGAGRLHALDVRRPRRLRFGVRCERQGEQTGRHRRERNQCRLSRAAPREAGFADAQRERSLTGRAPTVRRALLATACSRSAATGFISFADRAD